MDAPPLIVKKEQASTLTVRAAEHDLIPFSEMLAWLLAKGYPVPLYLHMDGMGAILPLHEFIADSMNDILLVCEFWLLSIDYRGGNVNTVGMWGM